MQPGSRGARRLRYGLAGAARAAAGRRRRMPAAGRPADGQPPKAKAKSVIQIWMWGGPPHLDTFDPKPDAGYDYCGPLNNPIPTNVDGIRIGELLPLLAKQADKFSIIRSMTHGNDGHETAAYLTQTGRRPGDRLVYPSAGAVVSLFKGYDAGYKGLIPPYIVLTQPQGRFSEAGFLGPRYKPFATGGDPAQQRFMVEGVVAQGINDQQQKTGASCSASSTRSAAAPRQPRADRLLSIGGAGLRHDPGRRGQGVRSVPGKGRAAEAATATALERHGPAHLRPGLPGGATPRRARRALHHHQLPRLGYAQRQFPDHAPQAAGAGSGDGYALADLSDRGLLESTIVWWSGEFGRTPKIDWGPPWNGGRHHYGKVFSAVVAGGGFKGGCVVGASDAKGEEVKDRPVYPCDLLGSIYQLMGIDPDGKLPNPMGMALTVTPSTRTASPWRAAERDHVRRSVAVSAKEVVWDRDDRVSGRIALRDRRTGLISLGMA